MFFFIDSDIYLSPKNKRLAKVLTAIAVAILVIVPSAYYLNHFLQIKNQPEITYTGGYTNYTWSENFSRYAGYMKNLSSTVAISENGHNNSLLQLSLFQVGYNRYAGGPIMNLYATLNGSFSSELRPTHFKFYEITSNIGNMTEPYYMDSGAMNPINPTNLSVYSSPDKRTFSLSGNSTQSMYFMANFINEAHNRSRYNFSIDQMDVHFLLPSFLSSNNSITLTFGATIYGLSKTVSTRINVVMNDTDLSG